MNITIAIPDDTYTDLQYLIENEKIKGFTDTTTYITQLVLSQLEYVGATATHHREAKMIEVVKLDQNIKELVDTAISEAVTKNKI